VVLATFGLEWSEVAEDNHSDKRTSRADLPEATASTREVRRITWIGLVGNVLISGLKLTVGIAGSSQAVIADAVHSISDIITDVAVLVGVRYWTTPPDECHPYGHRRIEAIVTVGIGAALGAAGLLIGYEGIASVRNEHIRQPGLIALTGALVSIVTKEILYRWTQAVGKRIGSPALRANAWHHRSDALSSIPAAIAVAVASIRPELSFVDHMGAVIVAVFILHASWKIIKPALAELSDQGAPQDVTARIREVALATDEVTGVHALRTRRMGPGVMVDLHITVDGTMSVTRGHDVSKAVKRRIKEQVEEVLDVVVHLEPAPTRP
jgi:cation diffusion facilitator family transporter